LEQANRLDAIYWKYCYLIGICKKLHKLSNNPRKSSYSTKPTPRKTGVQTQYIPISLQTSKIASHNIVISEHQHSATVITPQQWPRKRTRTTIKPRRPKEIPQVDVLRDRRGRKIRAPATPLLLLKLLPLKLSPPRSPQRTPRINLIGISPQPNPKPLSQPRLHVPR
jgi:hypothetical protein